MLVDTTADNGMAVWVSEVMRWFLAWVTFLWLWNYYIINSVKKEEVQNYQCTSLTETISWCYDDFSNKEMVIDFRVKKYIPDLIVIANEQVERIMTIDDKLTGSPNTQQLYTKCQQRIYYLRVLENIRMDNTILSLFYKSVVESVLCFLISIWFG